jgi:hypothetical protein
MAFPDKSPVHIYPSSPAIHPNPTIYESVGDHIDYRHIAIAHRMQQTNSDIRLEKNAWVHYTIDSIYGPPLSKKGPA